MPGLFSSQYSPVSEDVVDVESRAPAGVFDVVASGTSEQVVGERT